ncbi:hypothetical protein NPIL_130451 [Nephila pilipes]|uniref:Uncharacterized protein n=1 Tax=Nephila pilipes TaxID=299642 RepID=A0A8X6TB88_NEPPI|nr:hypothetical protein NPIL_130451 [Nephila pilipes]
MLIKVIFANVAKAVTLGKRNSLTNDYTLTIDILEFIFCRVHLTSEAPLYDISKATVPSNHLNSTSLPLNHVETEPHEGWSLAEGIANSAVLQFN